MVRRGKVRRAKLYYLRGLTGKAARIQERAADVTPKGAAQGPKGPTAQMMEQPPAAEQQPQG